MTFTMRSLRITLALMLIASIGVFAADFSFDGEYYTLFETTPSDKIRLGSIENAYHGLKLNTGIEETDRWSLKLNNEITLGSSGNLVITSPEYRVTFNTDIVNFDMWGNNFDAGSEHVLSDPVHLLVLGSSGPSPHLRQDPVYSGTAPKFRATFNALSQYNAIVQIHRISTGANGQTNLELYGDRDLNNDYNIGGILRRVIYNDDAIDNTTTAVIFGSTDINGYTVAASIGSRFGNSVGSDALAFGLTTSTDYSEALNLQASFVQRGANYYAYELTSDRTFQATRFRNASSTLGQGIGKGSAIEIVATYRGEGDRDASIANYVNEDLFEDRTINNFIDPYMAAKYPSFSAQGIIRLQSDESNHAEQHIVARAGFPVMKKLWGAAELALQTDQDGAGTVAGVTGDSMTSRLITSFVYELNTNWDAHLGLGYETAHASSGNGTELQIAAAVKYEMSDLDATTTFGYLHSKASNSSQAANQLVGQFEIKF